MKKTLIILLATMIINCSGGTSDEVTVITLGSLGDKMEYDTTEFTVKAGSKVKLTMI